MRPSHSGRACAAAVLGLSLFAIGCGGAATSARPATELTAQSVPELSDAQFAEALHAVLRDGKPSSERTQRLAGVVRAQLRHASERFKAGDAARGTDSVIGAFMLLGPGEGRAAMVDAVGAEALGAALEQIAPRGDEGQAYVLLRALRAALPAGSPGRADAEEHLEALDRWVRTTRSGGPMLELGADRRIAVSQALLDPDPKALAAAAAALDAWIGKAIEYNDRLRSTGEQPERDEAMEAAQALQSGGLMMASLFLRYGDARAAVTHLEETSARRVISPALYDGFRAAAEDDDAAAWQQLLGYYYSNEDLGLDPLLLRGARWGGTLALYRRDPSSVSGALTLGRELVGLGMDEAAPLVMADALGAKPTAQMLSAALTVLGNSIQANAAKSPGTARRTFALAAPILAKAAASNATHAIEPSVAQVRFAMGSLEMNDGNLAAAREQLLLGLRDEPAPHNFLILANVERQLGLTKEALGSLGRVEAKGAGDDERLYFVAARLLAYKIHRDAGEVEQAREVLKKALDELMSVRRAMLAAPAQVDRSTRAHFERLLAQVLDAYGDSKGATSAFARALDLAEPERDLLSLTVLNAVGRSLVKGDLAAGRAALKAGLAGNLDDDDLVYAGLWVTLLERGLHVPSDGTAASALATGSGRGWTGKLAAWAEGRLTSEALLAAAQTSAERIEAEFYGALARKIAGDPLGESRLREVAKSPTISILEVQLADELTAPDLHLELPQGVAVH